MLRKLTIWLLLPTMLLNGLWMVCNPPGETDSQQSERSADCIRICATLAAVLGHMCFLLPGDTRASITIIDFGAAILPGEILLQRVATEEPFVEELPASPQNPSLSRTTPPPRV
ncbi:MAG TPA: hypothetical protein VE422_32070 [Terriglobia bacterium]|nr:hypothetical protein [Terriglobia bacterium]